MTRQVIGYYKPLRTFFLQGFYEEESVFDEPEIRLGTCLEEFPTLESIVEEACHVATRSMACAPPMSLPGWRS